MIMVDNRDDSDIVRHGGPGQRAAVQVDSTRQRINRFFGTVALNRSGQVRVGDHRGESLAWLLAD
jgi:hypothetical protein